MDSDESMFSLEDESDGFVPETVGYLLPPTPLCFTTVYIEYTFAYFCLPAHSLSTRIAAS